MSAPPLSENYIKSRLKEYPTFKCCQCKNELEDDGDKIYRTFLDDGGSSINDPDWRICKKCSGENRTYNFKLFIGLGAFVLLSAGFKYLKEVYNI